MSYKPCLIPTYGITFGNFGNFGNHWIFFGNFFLNTYLIWLGIREISKPNLNHISIVSCIVFDKNKGRWTRWRKTNSLRKEMRICKQRTQMFLRLIMMHAWCSLFLRKETRTRAKHSNVFSFDHDACMVQLVFEARNEDASKALKCFFVWSWCMHCAACFWGKKWGREQSTQVFLRLIMRCMFFLLCILSKKWGHEQSTQIFLRLIVAKMSDILIQASCLHLLFHRWDLPLLFLSLSLDLHLLL